MEISDISLNSSNQLRPPAQRIRRDSCQSLFTSTLPTIHEVEPLMTPPLSEGVRPCGPKTQVHILPDGSTVHDDHAGQLAKIISAHGNYVSPRAFTLTPNDQHMVTWGFTAFRVEQCMPHYTSNLHSNKAPLHLHDNCKQIKTWTPSTADKSGDGTADHTLSNASFCRMDSHGTEKTDPSTKLLSDSVTNVTKSCSQRLQMRIMIALGFLFVSGIIVWILSPFLPL